mmetsp:Transcript_44848/g.124290  ORF Transcript_44848/g.124290 Transcript_44848/m.124290 type:complete len:156 (+) Transcript_44848:1-468(+)
MTSTVPATIGITAPTIMEQLEFTRAPIPLCAALAEAVGLELDRDVGSLGPGSAQVFSLVKTILVDPDVFIAFRPLALVPLDVRAQIATLLQFWQGAGGLPAIAELLGHPLPKQTPLVYRSPERTLVVGNSLGDFDRGFPMDVHVDLETLLWKDTD